MTISKFSNLKRLNRVTCYVLKFIYSFSRFERSDMYNQYQTADHHLTAAQLDYSQKFLIKNAQNDIKRDQKSFKEYEKIFELFYDNANIL